MESQHLPPPTNTGPAVNVTTGVLLAVAIVCIVLRCYVRVFISKCFGWDDGFIVFTLGLLIAGDVCLFNMTGVGMGQHLLYLPNPTYSALQVLKWNTIYQVVNVLGAFFTKLSIGIFLLRLKNTRRFTLSVWLVLTPLALATAIVCLTVLLQCIPLYALWEPTVKGRCIANTIPLNISYVQSAFAIIADLYLTLSPIVILWKVQISIRKKVAICALMSLGLMATIANALRNAFIPNLVESDFSYTIVPIVVVADLEFSLGVIAACIPTLMPLFKKCSSRKPYSKMSYPVTNGSGTRRTPQPNLPLSRGFTVTDAQFDRPGTGQSDYPLNKIDRTKEIAFQQSYAVSHEHFSV